MFLLICACVSIGAAAIEWYNRRKISKVEKEIEKLQELKKQLYEDHNRKIWNSVEPLLETLLKNAKDELKWLYKVEVDLKKAHVELDKMIKKEADLSSPYLRRALFELDCAMERLKGEMQFWQSEIAEIEGMIRRGDLDNIPCGIVPIDFPYKGNVVPLEQGQRNAQGFYITNNKEIFEDGLYFVEHANYDTRKIRVNREKTKIMHHLLNEPEEPIEVIVIDRDKNGLVVDADGQPCFIPKVNSGAHPNFIKKTALNKKINAYVVDVPFTTLCAQHDAKEPEKLPQLALRPRTIGLQKVLIDVPVLFEEYQTQELIYVIQEIERRGFEESPWYISLYKGMQLAFTVDGIGIILEPDSRVQAFRFVSSVVNYELDAASIYLKVDFALILSHEILSEEHKENFELALQTLNAQLLSEQDLRNRREGALKYIQYKKIYEAQVEYQEETAIQPVLLLKHEKRGNHHHHICSFMLMEPRQEWAKKLGEDNHQIFYVGNWVQEHLVERISQVEGDSTIVTLVVHLTLTKEEEAIFNPNTLSYLVNKSAVSSARKKVQAIEDILLGRFVSSEIRDILLNNHGRQSKHKFSGKKAVLQALASDEAKPLFAIWGPPGTGKTTTIVAYLKEWLASWNEKRSPKILIAAPTHVAVNEVMHRFYKECPELKSQMIRFCNEEKIENADASHGGLFLDIWWETKFEELYQRSLRSSHPMVKEWERLYASSQRDVQKWQMSQFTLFGATCMACSSSSYGLQKQEFDLVLIDEAGKALGAELLIPSSLGHQVILVGDHKQLPPTITDENLNQHIRYHLSIEQVDKLLRASAFEQLFDNLPIEKKGMLDVQYRMPNEVGFVISKLFYQGDLKSHRTTGEPSVFANRINILDFSENPRYKGIRPEGRTSYENKEELVWLNHMLISLQKKVRKKASIAVVSSYKRQGYKVKDLLNKNRFHNVVSKTIDAFQGGEADVVLMLMTRNSGGKQFLLDQHRLNVAISRTKEALFIFAHAKHLRKGKSSPFEGLENALKEKGLHYPIFIKGNTSPRILEQIYK